MKCSLFSTCNAPLCPDDSTLETSVWFPGEEVCRRVGITFATIQRRIMRASIGSETCFTVSMLRRNISVTKTLRGLAPERPRAEALDYWFRQHKGRAPLSEEEKERRRGIIRGIKCPDSPRNGNRQGLPRVSNAEDVKKYPASFRALLPTLAEGAEAGGLINNPSLGTDSET